jgi:hypothetical protein
VRSRVHHVCAVPVVAVCAHRWGGCGFVGTASWRAWSASTSTPRSDWRALRHTFARGATTTSTPAFSESARTDSKASLLVAHLWLLAHARTHAAQESSAYCRHVALPTYRSNGAPSCAARG